MLKFIRYALATVCFAASVGCLALWWRSMTTRYVVHCDKRNGTVWIEARRGYFIVEQLEDGWTPTGLEMSRYFQSAPITPGSEECLRGSLLAFGEFGAIGVNFLHFPVWYPALVFALAGVGVLRFRRQFSIRSALICLTVVAALLGMVVAQ